jgi:general secretion pathway protein C
MQLISLSRSFNRPDLAQTAVVSLATVAVLALMGWVLAYWTWEWFSPQTEVRVEPATVPTGRAEAASGLFGRLQQQVVPMASTIRLIGVIASSGSSAGYALLRYAEQPVRTVREGDEISPGIRLAEVHPEKIVINRGGIQETVALPKKMPPEPTASPLTR